VLDVAVERQETVSCHKGHKMAAENAANHGRLHESVHGPFKSGVLKTIHLPAAINKLLHSASPCQPIPPPKPPPSAPQQSASVTTDRDIDTDNVVVSPSALKRKATLTTTNDEQRTTNNERRTTTNNEQRH